MAACSWISLSPAPPFPMGKGVVSACASVLHTCCLTPFSYRQPLPIGKGPPAGREIGRRVRWQSLGTFETDYGLRRQKTALSFVVSLICVLWLPAHGSPYPPCPMGRGVISACASVLHTCCLTPFSYRQPLPIGKGPPAGRGIGRRVRWQSLSTYETDYDLRRQKTPRSHS